MFSTPVVSDEECRARIAALKAELPSPPPAPVPVPDPEATCLAGSAEEEIEHVAAPPRASRSEYEETEQGRWCHYCILDDEKKPAIYVAVPCGHCVACRDCGDLRPYKELRTDLRASVFELAAAFDAKTEGERVNCPFCKEAIILVQLIRQ